MSIRRLMTPMVLFGIILILFATGCSSDGETKVKKQDENIMTL
ncbi:hypothetical protein [Virgibacillus halodenitrificans]|nr:hypothetical protein [Virgibacillus halodenitrificans]CDQ32527.1 hypothetical protein BN993_01943 [Virgibacillus halodenitrificans]